MRADICEPDDVEAVDRFKAALKRINAVLTSSHESSLGVDLRRYSVADEELLVFVDHWSIDVEGPESVVKRLIALSAPDPGREAGG